MEEMKKSWKISDVLLRIEIPVLLGKIMAGQPTPEIRPYDQGISRLWFPLIAQ